MKLLCVGDIHLGRQPSRLGEALVDKIAPGRLGPAAAWQRSVDFAIAQQVDAVLLAGDVVEQQDDFYEAYGDLRAGVERLVEADIRVIGVAGNHDVEVLPRLADAVTDFELLGRGGQWESLELQSNNDSDKARVLGWSFPETVVSTSPLDSLEYAPDNLPTIGLLHCDRDQTGSRYAPVRSSEFDHHPVDAWLLGHIHRPDALESPKPTGYLGSLSGMDPGEPGPHGPWLLEIKNNDFQINHIPLAPLRWEEVTVPVDDLAAAGDIHTRIVQALDQLHERLGESPYTPEAVGCRLRLTGRTEWRREIERDLGTEDPRDVSHERGNIIYFIHAWELDTLPSVDLAELAQGADPAGLLARKILILRGDDSREREALIESARERLAQVTRDRNFSQLSADPPNDEETRVLLEQAALHALDELLAQHQVQGESGS